MRAIALAIIILMLEVGAGLAKVANYNRDPVELLITAIFSLITLVAFTYCLIEGL